MQGERIELLKSTRNLCFVQVTHSFRVSYDEVASELPGLWERHSPALAVHVGVYTEGVVAVERRSFNLGYCRPDTLGQVPPDNRCVGADCDAVLNTSVDVDQVKMATGEEP